MVQTVTRHAAWDAEPVTLRAFWEREYESTEWIAATTATFINGLVEFVDVPAWTDVSGTPWPTDSVGQREFVERAEVMIDGKAAGGYGLSLYGPTRPGPELVVDAGTGRSGRIPLHTMGLVLDPRFAPLPRADAIDDLVALTVRTWEPLAVDFTTNPLYVDAGRSGWDIPVGYRVWISPEVGAFTDVADGLSARPFEGGSLLSAPDDWYFLDVAEAIKATLDMNGLDEVPHQI